MYDKLRFCALFDGISPDEIASILDNTEAVPRSFVKGDIIALKGAQCSSLIILTAGAVRFEASDKWGKESHIERLTAPGTVLPVLLYSPDNRIPVNIIAADNSEMVFIPKSNLTAMMQGDVRLLENFLTIVSNRNRPVSDRIMYLGFKSIKGKFANLLLEQSRLEESSEIKLKMTQREMADLFGVTRPALARAIGEMEREGSIYADRKKITIIYPEKLQQYARRTYKKA